MQESSPDVYCFVPVWWGTLQLTTQLKLETLLFYCMTGRAIQGNIQFEGGSIGPTAEARTESPSLVKTAL